MTRPALFLDRDGTIIEDPGYLNDPEGVRLLPGAALALRTFQARGYALVVISNQSGIARGKITPAQLAAVHARMVEVLRADGVELDGVRYCEHGPDDGCPCRKPAPGMLLDSAQALDLDLAASFMVGDKPSDLEAGKRAGTRTAYLGPDAPPDADASAATWSDLLPVLSQHPSAAHKENTE